MKDFKSNPNNHYEWCVMPEIYLSTALFIAKEILPKSKEYDYNFFINDKNKEMICSKLNFASHFNVYFIYPIIYNFKHGIELYIKALGNIDYGDYFGSHDLKFLFDKALENTEKDGLNYKILKKLKDYTWEIIKKYYYGTYYPLNKDEDNPDKKNESERFPEGQGYKIENIIENVNFDIIFRIIKDIELINKKFSSALKKIRPTKLNEEQQIFLEDFFKKNNRLDLLNKFKNESINSEVINEIRNLLNDEFLLKGLNVDSEPNDYSKKVEKMIDELGRLIF